MFRENLRRNALLCVLAITQISFIGCYYLDPCNKKSDRENCSNIISRYWQEWQVWSVVAISFGLFLLMLFSGSCYLICFKKNTNTN